MAKESYANPVVDDRTKEVRPFGIKDKLGVRVYGWGYR